MIKGYIIVDVKGLPCRDYYFSCRVEDGRVRICFCSDKDTAYVFFTKKQAQQFMMSKWFKAFKNLSFCTKYVIQVV